jgi:hypothetical protein
MIQKNKITATNYSLKKFVILLRKNEAWVSSESQEEVNHYMLCKEYFADWFVQQEKLYLHNKL